MNVLFSLTPKCDCAYLEEDDTLRNALEKMEVRKYNAIPLLSKNGQYIGTITEGDLLWHVKNNFPLDLREAERISIMKIARRKDYMPISIRAEMSDLLDLAMHQNFVPVSDDDSNFIGIIRRQEIIKYLRDNAMSGLSDDDDIK